MLAPAKAEGAIMKRILRTAATAFLSILLAALPLAAATFSVAWDPPSVTDGVTSWNVYSIIGLGNRSLVATVTTNLATITMPDGIYQLTAAARNVVGEGPPSLPLWVIVSGTNVVGITSLPGKPINLQLR